MDTQLLDKNTTKGIYTYNAKPNKKHGRSVLPFPQYNTKQKLTSLCR